MNIAIIPGKLCQCMNEDKRGCSHYALVPDMKQPLTFAIENINISEQYTLNIFI